MATFYVSKVSSANLDRVPIKDGQMIFVTDVQKIYFDYDGERKLYSGTGNSETAVEAKTLNEWAQDNNVYPAGTILVYTDRTTVNGVSVADIKVANGTSSVSELPFLHDASVANYLAANNIGVENGKLDATMKHSITIGDYVYDGSADIIIPVYNGE